MVDRFWEIDSLRGIAIIMMIFYHLLFDLNLFGNFPIDMNSGALWILGRTTAFVFIFIVGICLAISFSRVKNISKGKLRLKYLKRGLKIFSWGLIISLITWLFLSEGVIFFGILHFIGISIILAYPFLRFKKLNLFLGLLVIVFGVYLYSLTFDFSWLLWLGFKPENLYTFDYFPIFPWFGIILIGLFFGKLFYSKGKRGFKVYDLSNIFPFKVFSFLGRNSLLIYLIHQPILIGLLYLFVL